MHGLLRKLPLRRNHFFEWLKTAVLLIDCGTSTLKSLPSRVFAAPHVHPRLRKCLSRCTLDCGFKTSESPALRGFEAERGPITGTSLYLVLKSNGPHRSKNPPVKFGFSPKTVPANIAKKLPSQRCFKPLFIASFNFSHKRRNIRFKGLRRVHTPPHPRIVHTAAYTPKQGAFRMGVVSLHSVRSARSRISPARVSERQTLQLLALDLGCSQRTQRAFGTAMRLCASLFRRRRGPAGLRNPFSFLSKLRLVCPALRGFPCVRGEGWYHYPQRALRTAETPDGRLSKRLICRFLRSGGRSSPHDSYFLANTQNFLLAVPVANTFALWYDKFDKLELG